MTVLTFDFETTTYSNGSVFDQRNKAVCVGFQEEAQHGECLFDMDTEDVQRRIDGCSWLVGFNAKFDLHWLRKIGVDISNVRVWDCQLAEFFFEGQTNPYPSLNKAAEKYGFPTKLDVVKTEYWDKEIQTDEIPRDVLSEYCLYDIELTYKVYQKQLEQFQQQPALFKLFKIACQDLLVLEEMEWNGMRYDPALCAERSKAIEAKLVEIKKELDSIYPDIPINFGSGDQLSAFLYGGVVKQDSKEHIGFYKTGDKAGQPKYKNIVIEHRLPRLVEPLAKSELKKEGYWKTDEATLRKLKGPAARKFVGPLLEMAKLDKLNGTYYLGLPKLAEECYWSPGMIYGNFNQCVARTGRLSSTKPNLQNQAGDVQDVFVSRYTDEPVEAG
jgi:DNA polymerase I-like protein with 3'-5' exonuclease and polymerase domains